MEGQTGRLMPRAPLNEELRKVRRIVVCTGVNVLRRQADQHKLEMMSTPPRDKPMRALDMDDAGGGAQRGE